MTITSAALTVALDFTKERKITKERTLK